MPMPNAPRRYKPPHQKPAKTNRSKAAAARHKWYDRRIWRDVLRPAALLRDGYRCTKCGRMVSGKTAHVDHEIPFGDSEELFIDPANHQTMCQPCHSSKTMGEQ